MYGRVSSGKLEYLIFHMDKVISTEEITEYVWDNEVDFSNSFKYHMYSLKKRLSKSGGDCIKDIRGQRYVIRGGKYENSIHTYIK